MLSALSRSLPRATAGRPSILSPTKSAFRLASSASSSVSSSSPPHHTPKLSQADADKLSNEIFGTLPHPGAEYNHQYFVRSGNKVLRRNERGTKIARYYFEPINKYAKAEFPGWVDDVRQRRREKVDKNKRRGKGAPKKGEGKRSKKR